MLENINMRSFIYNIRRTYLHMRRRHRPSLRYFGYNFKRDPFFRIMTIFISLVVIFGLIIILSITVLPDNSIKAFLKKDIEVIDAADSNKTTPVPNATLEPTPIITPAATTAFTPSFTPDANASPTPLPVETQSATTTGYIVAPSGLVVRTGPSQQHAKLGVIPYGRKVEIISRGTWHFIVYEEGGAYVHSKYVVIGDAPPGDSTKYGNTSDTWTSINISTKILVEKIFYDRVTIYVADIQTSVENFLTQYNSEFEKPSVMAINNNAVLAVNGDFFGIRDDGIIIRNGEILRDKASQEIAVLYEDGRLEVYFADDINANQLLQDGAIHTWSIGPILVKDSKAYDDFTNRTSLDGLNPRTGIGMIKPNHYIIIVADGRQENSIGLTLVEFAELFESYGSMSAYNLDGGSSSVMIFNDEIISSPSGIDERLCSDIIYFN